MTARVVLAGVSTREVVDMIQRLDDVVRELALIQTGLDSGQSGPAVPVRVLDVMAAARAVLFEAKEVLSVQAAEAWRRGEDHFDAALDLPEEAGPAVLDVLDALETVDRCATEGGSMLIPATPAALAEFRRKLFHRLADAL